MSKQNTPIKPIPLPDYEMYRAEICTKHHIALPLKPVPPSPDGILKKLPAPLATGRTGWPWDAESVAAFTNTVECPKISVVIPSYNQGAFIEETIRSVVLQNYPALELIIIDGGSDDQTLQVINHYQNFISLALSEPDRGQSHALNKGFAVATGALYFWLNSDDYLTKDCINRIVPEFIKNKQLDIAYGHGLIVDESGKITFEYAPLVTNRFLRFGGIVLSHSVMWRQQVHCAIWEDLQCAMDAELWLRLFPGRRLKHLHFPIGVFRRHRQQKTSLASMVQKWNQDFNQYIWPHYPSISKKRWSRRQLEYRFVQKVYRLLHPYHYTPPNEQ
jgi:glycosyltransferase involved in cell wall biosynthesis